jgi:hypothetical protein
MGPDPLGQRVLVAGEAIPPDDVAGNQRDGGGKQQEQEQQRQESAHTGNMVPRTPLVA